MYKKILIRWFILILHQPKNGDCLNSTEAINQQINQIQLSKYQKYVNHKNMFSKLLLFGMHKQQATTSDVITLN